VALGVQPSAGLTPRMRLAAAVRQSAISDPDIVEVRGRVGAVAVAGGGFEVSVALVARMVPLRPLGERLRERVEAWAAAELPDGELREVRVDFVDVRFPEQEAAAARAAATATAAVDAAVGDLAPALPPAAAIAPAAEEPS